MIENKSLLGPICRWLNDGEKFKVIKVIKKLIVVDSYVNVSLHNGCKKGRIPLIWPFYLT